MEDEDDKNKIPKPKRKYLKSEFSNLADIALLCVELLKNTIDATGTDKIKEKAKLLHDAETQGDIIRDRVFKSFSLDKHPPSLQLDRMELLNKIETIINKCEHAGSQIELAGKYYPTSLLPELKEIMENVKITVSSVSKGVTILFESFDEAVEVVKDVEDIRDKTRDLVYELQLKALEDSSLTHQSLFAVDKISTQVSSVAEKAKDTAVLLEKMKLKYL